MKVLVTGHLGYIGVVMMPFLKSAGHDVVGVDSDLFGQCTYGPEPEKFPALKKKDIRDVTADDLKGFDAVCHLAALSNDPLGDLDPELTYEINFKASVSLALAARTAGVKRFLFSSSCSTYGASDDKLLDETAQFNPVTPYGRSKVLAEQEISQLATRDFSPTHLRNATAYGASPRQRFDIVLNNLVAWALCTKRVHIKSDGTPWRPIIHIEDIARGFQAALEAPREVVHNRAFNVGSTTENYQMRDLAEIVKETVPGCQIEYAAGGGPDKRCYRADFGRINRELPNFQPQWTARKGAQELYDFYQRVGLELDDFEGPRYLRIAHIRSLLGNGRLDSALRWQVPETALGSR